MSFADLWLWPEGLPLLVLAPALFFALFLLDRARARRLGRLAGPRERALAPDFSPGRQRIRRRLFAAGVFLALAALLEPTWGEGDALGERPGADVLVCLDVSRSMLARDSSPSRLEAAKREIRALAERVKGDRLGLVAFAGEARLVSPLTRDMASFGALVEISGPESVRRGGTDLGAAIETALAALPVDALPRAAIVCVTDGEDHEERGLRAAETCRERGVAVHCVGFGTEFGAKIAIETAGVETFLRAPDGSDVVSAMRSESLRRIAAAAGGEFLDAGSRPLPLLHLYERRILPSAARASAAPGTDDERRRRPNRFQWPLLAAVAAFMLELSLTDRKRR